MIWSDKFVVCSVPRTGTDVKSYMVVDLDGVERWTKWTKPGPHGKHGPLEVKYQEGMVAALTFRKLHSWLLSFCAMAHQTGLYPSYTDRKIPMPDNSQLFDVGFGNEWLGELPGSFAGLPDRYLDYMTCNGKFVVDRWLRCEHIIDDMVDFLGDMGVSFDESTIRERGRDRPFRKKIMRYNKDPLSHWSPETLDRLEELNPRWMEIQNLIYI